jgi:glutamate-5-semialdehyde dehydrogenase
MSEIQAIAERAERASRALAPLPAEIKNRALSAMADALEAHMGAILQANSEDLDQAKGEATSAFLDRLRLDEDRVQAMALGLREVAKLPDPVGEVAEEWTRPNGLKVRRVRIPLGVIGMIYEARPNVTADAAGLCLKSGNAVILRGGREALRSNRAIVEALRGACAETGVPEEAIQLVTNPDYALLDEMLTLPEFIDLIISRGGEALIQRVMERSKIPVLAHAKGVCHVYVDREADLAKAVSICVNAKLQRPGVCNAMETLLVHERIARDFLPRVANALTAQGVELRGCAKTRSLVPDVKSATEDDWREEYLDLILAVRVVSGLDEAIEHIARYGSRHTDAIVTENPEAAHEFLRRVDSSAVLWNASTRFNDGGELGLGAEIGISTTKLHAFGPMGLKELTTTKFVVLGDGQVRE